LLLRLNATLTGFQPERGKLAPQTLQSPLLFISHWTTND
jgi:hypothetical protein